MPYSCCLLHTPTLTVHYNPEQESLLNQWSGHQDAWQIREHALFIQSCPRAHTCRRILSDHSCLQGSWAIAAPWVAHQLSEQYAPLGVQAFARVTLVGSQQNLAAMQLLAQLG